MYKKPLDFHTIFHIEERKGLLKVQQGWTVTRTLVLAQGILDKCSMNYYSKGE